MEKLEKFMKNYMADGNPGANINEIQFEIMNSPITQEEQLYALRKAKTGKASGPDAITVEFYKYGGNMVHKAIIAIINYVFHNGVYPQMWSEGIINPIFKMDKMALPDNYRKITLLSSLGKLFDSVLNNRLCFCKTEIHGKMGLNRKHSLRTICSSSTASPKSTKPWIDLYICASSISKQSKMEYGTQRNARQCVWCPSRRRY